MYDDNKIEYNSKIPMLPFINYDPTKKTRGMYEYLEKKPKVNKDGLNEEQS